MKKTSLKKMNKETEKKLTSSLIYRLGKLQLKEVNAKFTIGDLEAEIYKVKKDTEKKLEELKTESDKTKKKLFLPWKMRR